jgi:formate hydrogenlyase transcriptional activator
MRSAVDPELIGESPGFRATLEQVRLVAPVDSTVLVQGETGTGKELIARAIHAQSRRSPGPFVTVNCAAIPAGLLESELFGHDRGAFTGAVSHRIGRFQLAHKGTLFLDEIGDLPLELQPKLLRALQEQEFERLGSSHAVRVDVRIVAATNQDLAWMVQERRFRADLYYRLNVFPIAVPALRDRVEDIPILVQHFVHEFAAALGKSVECVPENVMDMFCRRAWPGNIRELRNVIERSVLLSEGPLLRPPLSELMRPAPAKRPPAAQTLAQMERVHITETLQETNGIVGGPAGAAARLGLPRTTLISRMRKLGIQRRASALPTQHYLEAFAQSSAL